MARQRLIHPDGPKDEAVAGLTMPARLAWAYLPCYADREGRLADKPFTLRLDIFPVDPGIDMGALLDELARARLIIRYRVGSHGFIQIRTFLAHQKPHAHETASAIPPPPTDVVEATTTIGGRETEPQPPKAEPRQPMSVAAALDPDPVPDPVKISTPAGVPAIPVAPEVSGMGLVQTFARLRAEVFPGSLPWNTGGVKLEKAQRMADAISADPASVADVEPTMRRALERSKAATDARERETAFAFGVWCSKFTDLREEIRGLKQRAPAAEPVAYVCGFHRGGKNREREARQHDDACEECRHARKRARPRPPTEPAPADPRAGWPGAREPKRIDVRIRTEAGDEQPVESEAKGEA